MSGEDNPGPVPETETWIYGGIRAGQDGKRRHAWIDPAGEEHWFSRTGARLAVGSRYTVQEIELAWVEAHAALLAR